MERKIISDQELDIKIGECFCQRDLENSTVEIKCLYCNKDFDFHSLVDRRKIFEALSEVRRPQKISVEIACINCGDTHLEKRKKDLEELRQ